MKHCIDCKWHRRTNKTSEMNQEFTSDICEHPIARVPSVIEPEKDHQAHCEVMRKPQYHMDRCGIEARLFEAKE